MPATLCGTPGRLVTISLSYRWPMNCALARVCVSVCVGGGGPPFIRMLRAIMVLLAAADEPLKQYIEHPDVAGYQVSSLPKQESVENCRAVEGCQQFNAAARGSQEAIQARSAEAACPECASSRQTGGIHLPEPRQSQAPPANLPAPAATPHEPGALAPVPPPACSPRDAAPAQRRGVGVGVSAAGGGVCEGMGLQ